ncbi:MAG: choice-of-anchor U domain-containing protein [Bacteroidota bacterium]
MIIGKKIFSVLSIAMMLFYVLTPLKVFAYSGYGLGTQQNPYRISSCAQLQEINNNLSGYYILVSNIDCTGYNFTHLAASAAFSGTLDGQNHTIKNLVIDSFGLFYQTDGATIKNINISGGSTSSSGYGGSFVARATDTILTNLHSSMTVNGVYSYNGGIVGYMYGTSSVTASSFSGYVSGSAYSGGIVGAMSNSNNSVNDSFTTGTLHPNGAYTGLIVGGFFAGTISRVYTSGTIDNGVTTMTGGIIGDSQALLSNSFSAAQFTGTTADSGAVTAYNVSGTYTNVYYDKFLTNTAKMCNVGTCNGTAVNVGNSSPTFFMNNSTNGPLNTWDFNNVWQTTSSYPTLRNIALFDDQAGIPNNGDANNDGIMDSYQANVLSVQDNKGIWSTVTVPNSSGCTLGDGRSTSAISLSEDKGYSAQTNLTGFYVYCPTSGMTVTVTIVYDKQYSSPMLRYYNPITGAYSMVNGATYGTKTIGGITKTTATYDLTDGGSLDSDGLANGIIKDPVLLVLAPNAPVTGFGIYQKTPLDNLQYLGLIGSGMVLTALGIRRLHKNPA